jgi:hypothetical protein
VPPIGIAEGVGEGEGEGVSVGMRVGVGSGVREGETGVSVAEVVVVAVLRDGEGADVTFEEVRYKFVRPSSNQLAQRIIPVPTRTMAIGARASRKRSLSWERFRGRSSPPSDIACPPYLVISVEAR